jgi:hypothetical protein
VIFNPWAKVFPFGEGLPDLGITPDIEWGGGARGITMRLKWVLAGFGILYLVVALAFLPSEGWVSSPVEKSGAI